MRLHAYEWGDPASPPVVCLHGVTAHALRYERLATTRWADRFHVVSLDLRGHGRSGSEPPWTFATHVDDVIETVDALGLDRPDWVGHSFGGRLVLELAARHPDRIRRAVLLDPAIQMLPHVVLAIAEHERQEPIYASLEEYASSRADSPREAVLEDGRQSLETLPDGRLRRRACQAAVVSIYGELASEPPAPGTLSAPTLLVHAPAYGLVLDEQLAAYADRAEILAVPGMHIVMWDAFDEVAGAVESFLSA